MAYFQNFSREAQLVLNDRAIQFEHLSLSEKFRKITHITCAGTERHRKDTFNAI